jgi:ferredoxin
MKVNKITAGGYFVASECAGCGLCLEIAPRNFSMNQDEGHSFVSKQPTRAFEEARCREAMAWCPTDAIGNDVLEIRPGQYLEKTSRLLAVH